MSTPKHALEALIFGLFSALSLPLGALVGLYFSPVPPKVTAYFMSFGSGALVYAVATDLYGETICKLSAAMDPACMSVDTGAAWHHVRSLFIEALMGLVGAALYLALNKWLEQQPPSGSATPHPSGDARATELGRAAEGNGRVPEDAAVDAQGSSLSGAAAVRDEMRVASRRSGPQGSPGGSVLSGSAGEAGLSHAAALLGTTEGQHAGARLRHASRTCSEGMSDVGGSTLPRSFSGHMEARIPPGTGNARQVAMSMWLGVTLDGIPEALMLGFMTNDGSLTWVLLVSVFIANFPEAFSAASLLRQHGVPRARIVFMWTTVFISTGLLALLGSLILPDNIPPDSRLSKVRTVATSSMEGLTGGAMMAMVSTAMLPEAFHGAGNVSGLIFVLGFLVSVALHGIGAICGGPQSLG
mmetsp:Transcript_33446/g.106008  ORF Transcript_33446/g.106008 Transcript_33446/m.106008 type:complete len:413 (-) Transcript_33446:169-1407(-)